MVMMSCMRTSFGGGTGISYQLGAAAAGLLMPKPPVGEDDDCVGGVVFMEAANRLLYRLEFGPSSQFTYPTRPNVSPVTVRPCRKARRRSIRWLPVEVAGGCGIFMVRLFVESVWL